MTHFAIKTIGKMHHRYLLFPVCPLPWRKIRPTQFIFDRPTDQMINREFSKDRESEASNELQHFNSARVYIITPNYADCGCVDMQLTGSAPWSSSSLRPQLRKAHGDHHRDDNVLHLNAKRALQRMS